MPGGWEGSVVGAEERQLLVNNRQREKSPTEKMREALAVEEVAKARAKSRQVAGRANLRQYQAGTPVQAMLPEPGGETGRQARDDIAALLGVSGRTADEYLKVGHAVQTLKEKGREAAAGDGAEGIHAFLLWFTPKP